MVVENLPRLARGTASNKHTTFFTRMRFETRSFGLSTFVNSLGMSMSSSSSEECERERLPLGTRWQGRRPATAVAAAPAAAEHAPEKRLRLELRDSRLDARLVAVLP